MISLIEIKPLLLFDNIKIILKKKYLLHFTKIPSAKDFEKDCVNLSKINMVLLKRYRKFTDNMRNK